MVYSVEDAMASRIRELNAKKEKEILLVSVKVQTYTPIDLLV